MPQTTGYRLGAYCCDCAPPPEAPQQSGLDIIILMENMSDLTNSLSSRGVWGSQYENIFKLTSSNTPSSSLNLGTAGSLASVPYLDIQGFGLNSTFIAWMPLNLPTYSTSLSIASKAEIGANVITDTLKYIKRSHLQLNDTLKFYLYTGEPPNGNWTSGLLSPTDHFGRKNTLSLVYWPTFKSPINDPDPIGIKISGEFAADSDQNSSFSAILSDGRGRGRYKEYFKLGFKTYPTGNFEKILELNNKIDNYEWFRALDNNFSFVQGMPNIRHYLRFDDGPTGTQKGSYFIFNIDQTRKDLGNDEKTNNYLVDSSKIYKSQYSGYMVNVKDYFANGNSWPTGYGQVDGPFDLFSGRNNLNISSKIFPQINKFDTDLILSTLSTNAPFFNAKGYPYAMWNADYLFRIPESEKNKIKFRNVRVCVADFSDYRNSWLLNDNNPASLCVPYGRSKIDNIDLTTPLCPPDCLTDSLGCPGFNYLNSADANVTRLNEDYGIDNISPPVNNGLYFNSPALQVLPISGQGVGAVVNVLDNLGRNRKHPFPNDKTNMLNLISAPTILSKGFGYKNKPAIQFQSVIGSTSILEENFNSVLLGSNRDVNYTGWIIWTGNQKFPNVNNVFQADGAIMLSGAESYIQTSNNLFLNIPAGKFGFSASVKGWEPIEGRLKFSISGSNVTKEYINPTVNISGNFQTIYDEFDARSEKNIRLGVTSGRLFLDNINIFGPGSLAAAYERGWVQRCDFTNNFDHVYNSLNYIPRIPLSNALSFNGLVNNTIPTDVSTGISEGPVKTNQGFSALKNACLKFNSNSKKMIFFMCDGFPAFSGTIHNETNLKPSSANFPYPSKQEIKKLLNEKNIILHAIAFNSTYLPVTTDPPYKADGTSLNEYQGLSQSLFALPPRINQQLQPPDNTYDNNTKPGYISPMEEITQNLTGLASQSKLWILNRYSMPTGLIPTGIFPKVQPFNWPRERYFLNPGMNSVSVRRGGRVISVAPSSPLKTQLGMFYSIRKALGEED